MFNNLKQYILVVFLSVTVLACNENKPEAASPATQASELPVDAIAVSENELDQQEVIAGSIKPSQEVKIVSEISQKVVRVAFKDGQYVQKGTLLYKLNDAELKAKLKEVRAALKLAKLSESRFKNLLETETIRAQEYDEALSKLQAMEAQEELLLSEIGKTEIRAPFSGTMGISKVQLGSYVSPGLELASLENFDSVKIMFSVPERYLPLVKPGNKITFITQLSEQKFTATITASEVSLDMQSRSLNVQAEAVNPGGTLKGGLSTKVFFNTNVPGATGITIPSHALIPGTYGYNVYVIENGIAKLTPVKINNRTEREAVISEGLKSNDIVIISNIMRLAEGTPVMVVEN